MTLSKSRATTSSALGAPMSNAARIVGDDRTLPVALNAMKMTLTDVDKIENENNHGNVNAEQLSEDRLDETEQVQSNKPPPHWQLQ